MHDIRAIRANPEGFDAAMARRGVSGASAEALAMDAKRRELISEVEKARAASNSAAKEAGAAKARGDETEFDRLRRLAADGKDDIAQLNDQAKAKDKDLHEFLVGLPNLPADDVPDGEDESSNVEIRRWGNPRAFAFQPMQHYQLPAVKDGLDFETAARLSGSRFVVMSGMIARLHRALAQFMMDVHVNENGLTETWTPILVRNEMMHGTGQLPKFAEDSYFGASMGGRKRLSAEALHEPEPEDLENICSNRKTLAEVVEEIYEREETKEEFWLIPTAEVTLTNLVNDRIVAESYLPRRYVAHTQCFRSEAGSAGKDTAGMLRQHQFEKVEMVSVTHPEQSEEEHARMTRCAEDILERLGLPYRTVVLCTGDMGFGARRTHDIEVWLPGQSAYREISSVSTCGDFQARRMNARFRPTHGGKPEFVHTLNGSGLAVGRTLIAVLENGQEEDGSVTLPEALRSCMDGKSRIDADGKLA